MRGEGSNLTATPVVKREKGSCYCRASRREQLLDREQQLTMCLLKKFEAKLYYTSSSLEFEDIFGMPILIWDRSQIQRKTSSCYRSHWTDREQQLAMKLLKRYKTVFFYYNSKGRGQQKKNVFFRALPELPKPPPP